MSKSIPMDAIALGMAYLNGPKAKLSFGGDAAEYEITPRAEAALQWLLAAEFCKEIPAECGTPNRRSYRGVGHIGTLAKAVGFDPFDRSNIWPAFIKIAASNRELAAGSIITDAAAQFIALMIEEIHKTNIKTLQDELARRADLPPTTAQIMSDPRVKALVEAAKYCAKKRKSIMTDIGSAHSGRGAGASSWMREDDHDFYHDLSKALDDLSSALAAIKEPKP